VEILPGDGHAEAARDLLGHSDPIEHGLFDHVQAAGDDHHPQDVFM
jgi:hypothetical protein